MVTEIKQLERPAKCTWLYRSKGICWYPGFATAYADLPLGNKHSRVYLVRAVRPDDSGTVYQQWVTEYQIRLEEVA